MVNCCVNPACTAEHKLLRIGDVYAIERPYATTEFVWICSTCAAGFDVGVDRMGAVLVGRRSAEIQPAEGDPRIKLHLVERGVRGLPLQSSAASRNCPAKDYSGGREEHAHVAHI